MFQQLLIELFPIQWWCCSGKWLVLLCSLIQNQSSGVSWRGLCVLMVWLSMTDVLAAFEQGSSLKR